MGRWPQASFAAITPADARPPSSPAAFALSQNAPNPARESTVIRYTLPVPTSVNLAVFDLQGRMIAEILKRAAQAAGPQQVPISTAGWRPGCYLYRVEAGGLSATRKMVVLR
jgi:hypothetical protein